MFLGFTEMGVKTGVASKAGYVHERARITFFGYNQNNESSSRLFHLSPHPHLLPPGWMHENATTRSSSNHARKNGPASFCVIGVCALSQTEQSAPRRRRNAPECASQSGRTAYRCDVCFQLPFMHSLWPSLNGVDCSLAGNRTQDAQGAVERSTCCENIGKCFCHEK